MEIPLSAFKIRVKEKHGDTSAFFGMTGRMKGLG